MEPEQGETLCGRCADVLREEAFGRLVKSNLMQLERKYVYE